MVRRILALAFALLFESGCSKEVEHEWMGITLDMPRGTSISTSGTYTPPQGVDDPNAIRPGIVLIRPDTHDYFVELIKLPQPLSIEGMKYVLERQPDFVAFTHASSAGGNWELRYRWRNPDKAVVELWQYYFAIGAEHYQCTYSEGTTQNLALAKRICLSVRPRMKSSP